VGKKSRLLRGLKTFKNLQGCFGEFQGKKSRKDRETPKGGPALEKGKMFPLFESGSWLTGLKGTSFRGGNRPLKIRHVHLRRVTEVPRGAFGHLQDFEGVYRSGGGTPVGSISA